MLLLRKIRLYPFAIFPRKLRLIRLQCLPRLPRLQYPRMMLGILFLIILLAFLSILPDTTNRQPYLVIEPGTDQLVVPGALPDGQVIPVPITGR